MRRRLSGTRMLWAIVLLALGWFTVMFVYMDDLLGDKGRHKSERRPSRIIDRHGEGVEMEVRDTDLMHRESGIRNLSSYDKLNDRMRRQIRANRKPWLMPSRSGHQRLMSSRSDNQETVLARRVAGENQITWHTWGMWEEKQYRNGDNFINHRLNLNSLHKKFRDITNEVNDIGKRVQRLNNGNILNSIKLLKHATSVSDTVHRDEVYKHKSSLSRTQTDELPVKIKHRYAKRQIQKEVLDKYIYKQYTVKPRKERSAQVQMAGGTQSTLGVMDPQQEGASDDHNNFTVTDTGKTGPQSPKEHVPSTPTGMLMTEGLTRTHPVSNKGWQSQKLSQDMVRDLQDGFKRHSFNVSASEALPLNRTVPDFRPNTCHLNLPASGRLPAASVIICFHNEARSTLLRTVRSVLSTAPPGLLKQLILVDDASTYDYLGAALERDLAALSPAVSLHRLESRHGLVRARLAGVQRARGDVLVFLDSHCECGPGWLQPLLEAVQRDPTQVVCPEIDIIKDTTFEFVRAPSNLHGTFDWNLNFVWKLLPEDVVQKREASDTIRTPTMIGGLFAIDRVYFTKLGLYDAGMDIWGGENIELSFRIWQCGGRLLILPCSRVAHVFRGLIPYSFPAGSGGARATVSQNAARVAEVWLDQYTRFFYAASGLSRDPNITAAVSDRRELRERLQCHSFDWYLQNLLPDLVLPSNESVFFGQVENQATKACLTAARGAALSVTLDVCSTQQRSQTFHIMGSGRFVHANTNNCVSVTKDGGVHLQACDHSNTTWTLSYTNQLMTTNPGVPKCLNMKSSTQVKVARCTTEVQQHWKFTHIFKQDVMTSFL